MSESKFIGYEYLDKKVKKSVSSMYADGYESFGWQLDGNEEIVGADHTDLAALHFKRDRKIRNKAELTRLQRNFDACMSEILSLEAAKYRNASIAAYTVGILGTAFMAGSVFAVTGGSVAGCVLLAIPALIGWILPYFLYKKISKEKTEEVMPMIQQKYDEIYAVCEKASSLLEA